jgi:uncharacterized protein
MPVRVRAPASLALAAATLLGGGCGCSGASHGGATTADARPTTAPPPAADAAEPPAEPDAMPSPTVFLAPPDRPEVRVNVTLARTPAERSRGLMYVQHLPVDDGMLFIFEEESIHSFWMKNTLIPLDMIFIRADLTVAGVVENAEPLTLTPRTIDRPSQYVLEVNGGWAAERGVGEGTRVRFEGFSP